MQGFFSIPAGDERKYVEKPNDFVASVKSGFAFDSTKKHSDTRYTMTWKNLKICTIKVAVILWGEDGDKWIGP